MGRPVPAPCFRSEVISKKWMNKTAVEKWRGDARALQLISADDALVGETLLHLVPLANRRASSRAAAAVSAAAASADDGDRSLPLLAQPEPPPQTIQPRLSCGTFSAGFTGSWSCAKSTRRACGTLSRWRTTTTTMTRISRRRR